MAFVVIHFVSNFNFLIHSQCYHALQIVHTLVIKNFVQKQGEVQLNVLLFCSTLNKFQIWFVIYNVIP
jgi:hypothetical protein